MYDIKKEDIRPEGQSKMQAHILELAEYVDADNFSIPYGKSQKNKKNIIEYKRKKAKQYFQAANESEIKEAREDAKRAIELMRSPKAADVQTEKNMQELRWILKKYGLKLVTRLYQPITKAEKKVIRMDFYGTIDKPREAALSRFYQYFRNKHEPDSNEPKDFSHKYKKEDYNLYDCPSWNPFRQFSNFRKIENDIIEQMQDMGIPPDCLKPFTDEEREIFKKANLDIKDVNTLKPKEMSKLIKMGLPMSTFRRLAVEDFSDIIYLKFRNDKSSNHAYIFEGSRQQFVKDFINKCEKPFRMILEAKKVHPIYTDALVKSMKEKGVTDISPTDKNGNIIDGPKFSDHHKLAVHLSGFQFYLAKANFKGNQLLCMDKLNNRDKNNMHFDFIHGMDRIYEDNNGNIFQDAIEFENNNIAFLAGLSKIEQISYDYESDSRNQKMTDNVRLPSECEFITNEISYINCKEIPQMNEAKNKVKTKQLLNMFVNLKRAGGETR